MPFEINNLIKKFDDKIPNFLYAIWMPHSYFVALISSAFSIDSSSTSTIFLVCITIKTPLLRGNSNREIF